MRIVLLGLEKDISSLNLRGISSYLKANGHDAFIVFIPGRTTAANTGILTELVRSLDADLIGISMMTDHLHKAIEIAAALKARFAAPIILGGAHPTVEPEECLKYADMVCIGEGLETILELAGKMGRKEDYSGVKGLWLNTPGGVVRNPVRALEENVDKYPFPDYDTGTQYLLLGDKYLPLDKDILRTGLMGSYSIITSFGCPYSCTYCYENYKRNLYKGQGKYIRRRSMANVIAELKWALGLFPDLKYIRFFDDEFISRGLEDIKYFSENYQREIDLPFSVEANPVYVEETKIALLAAAGLQRIQIGVQSGSERVLYEIYNRRVSLEQIKKAAAILNRAKLNIDYDIIFNNPYETPEDLKATVRLLIRLPKPFSLQGYALAIFPRTDIFDKAVKDGFITLKKGPDAGKYDKIENLLANPLTETSKENVIYRRNYSNAAKRYFNALILLTPYLPAGLAEYFLADTALNRLLLALPAALLSLRYDLHALLADYPKLKGFIFHLIYSAPKERLARRSGGGRAKDNV